MPTTTDSTPASMDAHENDSVHIRPDNREIFFQQLIPRFDRLAREEGQKSFAFLLKMYRAYFMLRYLSFAFSWLSAGSILMIYLNSHSLRNASLPYLAAAFLIFFPLALCGRKIFSRGGQRYIDQYLSIIQNIADMRRLLASIQEPFSFFPWAFEDDLLWLRNMDTISLIKEVDRAATLLFTFGEVDCSFEGGPLSGRDAIVDKYRQLGALLSLPPFGFELCERFHYTHDGLRRLEERLKM